MIKSAKKINMNLKIQLPNNYIVEIIEKIYKSGSKIKSINSKEPDLEELFLELTNNDVN